MFNSYNLQLCHSQYNFQEDFNLQIVQSQQNYQDKILNNQQQLKSILPQVSQSQQTQQRYSRSLFKVQQKRNLIIQTNNDSNYLKMRNGHPKETKHLNQYTAIAEFFKVKMKNKQIPQIRGNTSNFKRLRTFFGIENGVQDTKCDSIRKQCQRYLRSPKFLKQIIMHKHNISQKKILMKYMDRIHMILVNPQQFNSWKHNS